MKILLLAIGKTSTTYISTAVDDYFKRINRYVPAEFKILPDVRSGKSLSEDAQKSREGKLILSALLPGDYVVLLDEHGIQQTSRAFSESIVCQMNHGLKRLVYIIGGPYGFSDEVYLRADSKLSLSKMTFTHEMIRLFFAEQIYRAMTIMRGEPYHHD